MSERPPEIHDAKAHRERRLFSAAATADPIKNGQLISSHALMLEFDLRLAYCAGAWISVIVLACAAVEAQERQVTANDYSSSARELFARNPDLQWLRTLRNEVVHAAEPGTKSQLWKVGGGDIGANQQALEDEATRAVETMFQAIYGRRSAKRSDA